VIALHAVVIAGQHAALLELASRTARARIVPPQLLDQFFVTVDDAETRVSRSFRKGTLYAVCCWVRGKKSV
jgi:hypothetical protein